MSWIADREGLRLVGDRRFSDLEFQELLSALRNTKRNNPARICDELERDLENSFIRRDTIWRLSKWCHWRGKNAQDIARRIGNLLFGRYPQPRFLDQRNQPRPNAETAQTRYEEWVQSIVRPSLPDSIRADTLYNSITQLISNAESICWSRFSSYLIALSLLILAWVGLFTATTHLLICRYLSIVVAFVGFIISFQWIGLLERSRAFLDLYVDLGYKFEKIKIGDTVAKNLTNLLNKRWDKYKDMEKEVLYKNLYADASINENKFENILPFIDTKIELKRLEGGRFTCKFYTSTCIFRTVTIAFIVLFCLMWILSIYSFIFLLIMHVKNTQF